MIHDPTTLPASLPAPVDDGAAAHLLKAPIPSIDLPSTLSGEINLASLTSRPCVLFFYPRTGVPGKAPPSLSDGTDWDQIPGMRGCTPQSSGFRDQIAEFRDLGVSVAGVSTQTTEYQREFSKRVHIPFPILSDHKLLLTRTMRLPSIDMPVEAGGPSTLIRRMAWFCNHSRIEYLWYPVFPPNENADRVLEWLRAHASARSA